MRQDINEIYSENGSFIYLKGKGLLNQKIDCLVK